MSDVSVSTPSTATVSDAELDIAIERAKRALLARQRPDGHFVFELEADVTIPAEYVLFKHYLGEEPDPVQESKIAAYLCRRQEGHGGWPLFRDGAFDMSASVKAYFALKMIGDSVDAPHMQRARQAILAHGGAAQSNVFTRALLALYGAVPWRAVPVMPIEIMHLPAWFPFNLSRVSYWARTVLVPLMVLTALKPRARNRRGLSVEELFVVPPRQVRHWPKGAHQKWPWTTAFGLLDTILRWIQPYFPKHSRQTAIDKAVAFVTERLNGENGLGAIFPAMVNSVMMFDALGYAQDYPDRAVARTSVEKLLVATDQEVYCQPCVSPVWDTALSCHALLETNSTEPDEQAEKCLTWLQPLQVLDVRGDWTWKRPEVAPGGWAFQYANPHYPDVDDTAVVVMALDRFAAGAGRSRPEFDSAIERGRDWILGMQSRNGGWGAFDVDNDCEYLNNIPFADHGALLDPPTADVTARCVSMLAQLSVRRAESPAVHDSMARGLTFLRRIQEQDGSWYGRWGMNYIYGTWSVLCALNIAGVDRHAPEVRRAVEWLVSIQNPDGGWGEDGTSYKLDYRGYEPAPSTASQTSWAILGLLAAGEIGHPALTRGIAYLVRLQQPDGFWQEEKFTATGFPRVFYLRYHGYSKFFPLWAMARYRNSKAGTFKPGVMGI